MPNDILCLLISLANKGIVNKVSQKYFMIQLTKIILQDERTYYCIPFILYVVFGMWEIWLKKRITIFNSRTFI